MDSKRPSGLRKLIAWTAICAVSLVGTAGVLWVRQIDEKIREQAERLVADTFPHLEVTIGSAKLRTGEGVVIRDISIVSPARRPSDVRNEPVFIEEIFLHCNFTLDQMIQRRPKIERVTIRRPTLRAHCNAKGEWDLATLLPDMGSSSDPTSVRIEDGTIHIEDHRYTPARSLQLKRIHLHVTPHDTPATGASRNLVKVEGSAEGAFFDDSTIHAVVDLTNKKWRATGSLRRLRLSPDLQKSFPIMRADFKIPEWELTADATINWRMSGTASELESFHLDGTIADGSCHPPRWPYPVTGIQARIACDTNSLIVTEGAASYGQARLTFGGKLHGLTQCHAAEIQIAARDLLWERKLAELLPQSMYAKWQKYQPLGLLDTDLTFRFDGARWTHTGVATFRDVTLVAQKFPYPLHHCRGTVHLGADAQGAPLLHVDGLTGTAGSSPVRIDARILHPGPAWAGDVKIRTLHPVALDNRLIEALGALNPKSREVAARFHAQGLLSVYLFLKRGPGLHSPIRPNLRLDFKDVQIKHDVFPYPLHNVEGTVSMVEGRWRFDELRGENDSAHVVCHGELLPVPRRGKKLDLHFQIDDLPLEEELRDAITPPAQALWKSMQPRGVLDHVTVDVEHYEGEPRANIDIEAHKHPPDHNIVGREISVRPTWFPYSIEQVTGLFRFNRDGRFVLSNVQGRHGNTNVSLDGTGESKPDGRWSVQLDGLRAEHVRLDRELTAALPQPLRSTLRSLQIEGPPLDLQGTLHVDRISPLNEVLHWNWDLRVDGDGLKVGGGLGLHDIFGFVRIQGQNDGAQTSQRGELHLDSVMLRQMQVTEVHGPFQVIGQRLVFGSWPPSRQSLNATPMSARLFHGTIQWMGQLTLDAINRLDLQMTYADGDLREVVTELANGGQAVEGRIFGDLHLSVLGGNMDTLEGGGNIRLRRANLYELPVVLSMLKILSNRQPDATAFTTSDAAFRLLGDRILLDYIDLQGDAISLKGTGEVGVDRSLDLDFYSIVGRDGFYWRKLLPLVSEMGRRFMQIEVTGTIDAPEIRTLVLPELNATVERLFPDQAALPAESQRK